LCGRGGFLWEQRREEATFSNLRVGHQQHGSLIDCLLSGKAKLRYLSQDMPIKQASEFQAIILKAVAIAAHHSLTVIYPVATVSYILDEEVCQQPSSHP